MHLQVVGLGAGDQLAGEAGVTDEAGEQALALGAEVRQQAAAPEVDEHALHVVDLSVRRVGRARSTCRATTRPRLWSRERRTRLASRFIRGGVGAVDLLQEA